MGRLPKEKVALSIYVTPKCKEKLDCLQKLYAIGDRKFSLSQIVEECIGFIYGVAYLSQDSKFWKGIFKLFKVFSIDDALNEMITAVLRIVQDKKSAAREVLTVEVDVKENLKREFGRKE